LPAIALAGAAALSACGGGQTSMTVHGTVQTCDPNSQLGSGQQVIITNSSGKVEAGISNLKPGGYQAMPAGMQAFSGIAGTATFKFTATLPAGQRYGIYLGGQQSEGTIWFGGNDKTPGVTQGC
jgi:hypothetical protein